MKIMYVMCMYKYDEFIILNLKDLCTIHINFNFCVIHSMTIFRYSSSVYLIICRYMCADQHYVLCSYVPRLHSFTYQ